jgi:hypothetical protein
METRETGRLSNESRNGSVTFYPNKGEPVFAIDGKVQRIAEESRHGKVAVLSNLNAVPTTLNLAARIVRGFGLRAHGASSVSRYSIIPVYM